MFPAPSLRLGMRRWLGRLDVLILIISGGGAPCEQCQAPIMTQTRIRNWNDDDSLRLYYLRSSIEELAVALKRGIHEPCEEFGGDTDARKKVASGHWRKSADFFKEKLNARSPSVKFFGPCRNFTNERVKKSLELSTNKGLYVNFTLFQHVHGVMDNGQTDVSPTGSGMDIFSFKSN